MFGLGPMELLVIGGVLLVTLGPTMLPSIGRYLGRSIIELRSSAVSFSANLKEEMSPEAPPRLTEGTHDTSIDKAEEIRSV